MLKKYLLCILLFCFSANHLFANCNNAYQQNIEKMSLGKVKFDKAGRITTGVVGGAVGAFYGTMGIVLLGPWYTFFAIGVPFGLIAAAPVGLTFFIFSKIKKSKIKKMQEMLLLLDLDTKTVEKYFNAIKSTRPELSMEDFKHTLVSLNEGNNFCDGSISQSKSRKLANPKDIKKFFQKHSLKLNLAF